MKKRVFVVTGPPGSGKSTWVHKAARENDVVFDLDKIHEAMSSSPGLHKDRKHLLGVSLPMRAAFLEAVASRKGAWENCFIITGSAKQTEIQDLLSGLDAEEIKIEKTKAECIRNIQADSERSDKEFQIERVNKWFLDRDSEAAHKSTRDQFAEWMSRH